MDEAKFGAINLNRVNELLEACLEDLLKRAENGRYHEVLRFEPIEQGKKVHLVNIGFVCGEEEFSDLFSGTFGWQFLGHESTTATHSALAFP